MHIEILQKTFKARSKNLQSTATLFSISHFNRLDIMFFVTYSNK